MAFVLFSTLLITAATAASAQNKLSDLIEPTWGYQNVIYQGEGDLVQLKLDRNSGAGFGSKSKFMYGKATIEMKLIEGDSAGTVTAFYMASEGGPYHNEFDFEFLGNASGEPYVVQTNVYINGVGNREQRITLWFDPTKDFHSYSILWTQRYLLFMVDETAVRVHYNLKNEIGMGQTMGVYSSIWNAEEWATHGGLLKTEWAHSPFVASFRALHVDACPCPIPSAALDNMRRCATHPSAIGAPLSPHATRQLRWVRSNHLIYDYCADAARFPTEPIECLHHRH